MKIKDLAFFLWIFITNIKIENYVGISLTATVLHKELDVPKLSH